MRPEESFVAQPVRSLQSMLQVIEATEGLTSAVVPDGIYGQKTQEAVSRFQKKHGLPVTGVTDQPTWEAVYRAFCPARTETAPAETITVFLSPGEILGEGDSGAPVWLTQAMLAFLNPGRRISVSGTMDRQTCQALQSFQALSGLGDTGSLNKATWKALCLQFALKAHHGRPPETVTD